MSKKFEEPKTYEVFAVVDAYGDIHERVAAWPFEDSSVPFPEVFLAKRHAMFVRNTTAAPGPDGDGVRVVKYKMVPVKE